MFVSIEFLRVELQLKITGKLMQLQGTIAVQATTSGCIFPAMNSIGKRIALARERRGWNQSELAREMNVTPQSVQAWEAGKNVPRPQKMEKLAGVLGVSVGELMTNDAIEGEFHRVVPRLESNVESGPDTKGLIPLISWVQAGSWSEIVDLYAIGDAEDWLPCPANHGSRAFALRVRGESMYDPHGRRSFREGDIVYVDPDRRHENGSLVIAKLTDSQEATFKQLVIEDEKRYLKALNPSWPERMMPINDNCHIVGVVFSKVELF